MEPAETTIGEYLIHRLYQLRVQHAFGIPGDYVLGFYKQLDESRIKIINTCDEQGAGFAATAYARVRGLGAVCVTYGVGGLKVVNTTAQAYAEETAVVVISGAPGVREQAGNPLLHHKVKEFDTQLKVFQQLTVAQTVLDNPATACREINRVLGAALCYRRPVYIELPRDMVTVKIVPQEEPLQPPDVDREPFREASREAVDMINAATQPVIVAGVELLRYGMHHHLQELVEKTNIPVTSTLLGKSAMGERHPGYIGLYEGGLSREDIRQYVESSDCIVLLGVLLTDLDLGIFTAHLDQGKSIHATSEKTSIRHHTYPGVYLNGFLLGLLQADIRRRETCETPHAPAPTPFHPAPDTRITVERLFQRLETFFDDSTFVIADTGDALFAAADISIPRAAEFMSSAYYASLGFAVPASLGVQLALPTLRPLVLVGDGAFQMTGMEVATAARYHLNPIIIVLNNSGYGTERPMLDGSFNDVYPWRYARLPELLGAGRGFDVQTEEQLEVALEAARGYRDGFCILDVRLDPYDFSPALRRMTSVLGKKVK
ncbi:alpha-keto acid decarboxylase family protein [Pelobacter propionicus]|uniref:Thiamine pyrophosphate enzyme TPP binding domain protein n=1 Tax=Pelobacter propionicus (strain DSM 2379 / NBRC 103807 / OttBd1) TaxID=338966 RepID=A1APB6_PELPD|nr:thiamine pyrophosphate-binding protein [Pelobacter propionicus]ABK99186.1 thiamine pyrophosphate enzyme TPP binding domain protein [Pelobacter propionicus DSM 2379]